MTEGVWFVALDAEDEETIWHQEQGQQPAAVLRRCELRHGYRDRMWSLIVRALP